MSSRLAGPFYKSYVKNLGLKGNERVLEPGSGSGGLSAYIAPILLKGKGKLTCVDISKAQMRVLRIRMRKYPNVEYKLGDISKMDIEDGSFDAAIIHFMLHEVEQPSRQNFVKTISRKLKAGGKLFIREPIRESHGMPVEEIRQLMAEGGLKEIDHKLTRSIFMGPMYVGIFEKRIRSRQEHVG
ncbi:MAG: class I SAM-dependent methyltransferase [Candidatus Freyarchaeum deiterrae]